MKKIIIGIIVVLAVVALGIKGKGLLKSRQSEIANEALPKVETITAHIVKARQGEIKNTQPYLAQILSDKSIKLSTRIAGYVQKVYVQESQKVKKGDLLVQIDATDIHSNITAINATLQAQNSDLLLAKSIYQRNQKLFEIGGLAKEKLDISKVALNAKKAMVQNTKQKLAQAKHQLSYLQIKAPFDGEVDSLILHEGDLAVAAKPILSLSNGGKKLVFSYAQNSKIVKGKKVLLENKEIGNIKTIYTTSKNSLTTAEVQLTKEIDLPVGSNLNIEVLTDQQNGCIIPQNSILHKKDGTYVLEYQNNKFSMKKIEILLSDKENLLISNCPTNPIAKESEVKLAKLPAYDDIKVVGEDYE
jgi:RND family efflux transporter MFP subunit